MSLKLACLLLLSSLGATGLRAHEVQPSVSNFSHAAGVLRWELRLNGESFVAGIDLDGLSDTDLVAESGAYDALRALPPEVFAPQLQAFFESYLSQLRIEAGAALELRVRDVTVPEIGNPDLPRLSVVVIDADLPPAHSQVQFFWPRGAGDLVLRQQGVEAPYTGYLQGGQSSPQIDLAGQGAQSGWQVFWRFIPVGFDHILPKGLDHILFVLALFFLSLRLRALIWQISAFTLAHTVTLALGALGWVRIPGEIVEPLIAASIVFVAVENLMSDRLSRWRPGLIFGFGLLHGLGFASVLMEFGLPEAHFVPALIGFNIGVEIGQLTVVALAFALVGYWFGHKSWYRTRIALPASAVIALIGLWWVIERVFL